MTIKKKLNTYVKFLKLNCIKIKFSIIIYIILFLYLIFLQYDNTTMGAFVAVF